MKSTGIIRRIDELGRIVIPKEIRSKLRISEGETLEIYVKEEQIILSKFSKIKNISDVATKLVETLSIILKNTIIVTDTQNIVVANKTSILNRDINFKLMDILKTKEMIEGTDLKPIEIENNYNCITYRIMANGDLRGSLIYLKEDQISEVDKELISMSAKFLSKYLEE